MTGYPPFGQDIVLTVDLLLILIVSAYCVYIYVTDLEFGSGPAETTADDRSDGSVEDHNVEGGD